MDGAEWAKRIADLVKRFTASRATEIEQKFEERFKALEARVLKAEQGTMRYCGLWRDGEIYDVGDVVTASGSAWIARTVTESRPGDSDDFQLICKRGRDGKSAR